MKEARIQGLVKMKHAAEERRAYIRRCIHKYMDIYSDRLEMLPTITNSYQHCVVVKLNGIPPF